MIFAKVKGSSGRGLDYSQFLEFLYYVGCMKYHGIDASLIPTSSSSSSSNNNRAATPPRPITPNNSNNNTTTTTTTATIGQSSNRVDTTNRRQRYEQIQKQTEIVNSARFGRYRGKNAITIK